MARSHSTLRSATLRERSAAVSGEERVQPLRAAVGRKVERIINAGSVHTARDVAIRSAVRSGQTRRQAARYGYYPTFRLSSPPPIAVERG
jgi:hypothetical protein